MPEGQSDGMLAKEFAKFFLQKIEDICNLFTRIDEFKPGINERALPLDNFSPLTCNEVLKEIMGMKNKTCELDPIPTQVLKQILPTILGAITDLVNRSLITGCFAHNWKTAIVRPLLKKPGLDLEKKNYRPVSNLSFLSKLVKQCMLKQLLQHCEDNHLLPNFQSAYRANYSTGTSLVKMVNNILWSMEQRHIMTVVFLDLSAAFDTVDHDILLSILNKQFGICGKVLKWFDSYLRPRFFKVKIGKNYSQPQQLHFSMPQGSCSGANVFTCYCSSINQVVPKEITLNGFADDHSLRKGFQASDRIQNDKQSLKWSKHLTTSKSGWTACTSN